MVFPQARRGRAMVSGVGALVRMAAYLLCAGALLRCTQVHAQGIKQLPKATTAIQVKPPPAEQLFRVESEDTLRRRILEEARQAKAQLPIFPTAPPSEGPFLGRFWPQTCTYAEPSYVCYGRLFFEQINSERYGWDLGPIHPLVSLGVFYFDVATLPYKLATAPCRCYECSSGYRLPGSPVPLLLYPPEWSVTGTVAEAAVIAALFLIFP